MSAIALVECVCRFDPVGRILYYIIILREPPMESSHNIIKFLFMQFQREISVLAKLSLSSPLSSLVLRLFLDYYAGTDPGPSRLFQIARAANLFLGLCNDSSQSLIQ
jgi:hypothetical protein